MKIGEIARATGVSVQTVRLYERLGLIPAANRLESGYRDYSPSTLDHVRAVKQGQRLGFTLAEMKDFVNLQQSAFKSSADLDSFLDLKRAQLDQRIAQLIEFRTAMLHLSAADYDWNANDDCPVVRLLADINIKSQARHS